MIPRCIDQCSCFYLSLSCIVYCVRVLSSPDIPETLSDFHLLLINVRLTLKANEKEAMSVTITLNDTAVTESTNLMKLLGITIDDKLYSTEHVKSIAVKAGRLVGAIMRLRNLILEKVKLQLHESAILTHLTYRSVVWNFIKVSHTRKLERIQEKALSFKL